MGWSHTISLGRMYMMAAGLVRPGYNLHGTGSLERGGRHF